MKFIVDLTIIGLVIAVKIPAMRVCSAICSTDCYAPLAMTDCNEKHARLFGGNPKNITLIGLFICRKGHYK